MTSLQERTANVISDGVVGSSWEQYEAARFLYAAGNYYAGSIEDVVVAAHCVWQLLCGEPIPEHEVCRYYPYVLPHGDAYAIARIITREYIPQDVTLAEMSPVIDEVHRVAGATGLASLFDDKRAALLFHICYPERGYDVLAAELSHQAGTMEV